MQAACLPPGLLDFLEVNVQRFLLPQQDGPAFEKMAEQASVCPFPLYSANCFLPASIKSTGPEVDLARIEDYAAVVFARAAQVGIKVVVLGSGASRRVPEGFPLERAREQFADVLRRLGPLAAGWGIVVALEPLARNDTNFINTVAEGSALVREVNDPAVGLLADFYHMMVNKEGPEVLAEAAELLVHLHVAEPAGRRAPGVFGADFGPYLGPLAPEASRLTLALECAFPEGLAADVPRAVRVLRGMGA